MLKLFVHKKEVPIKHVTFPAGESLISIEDTQPIPLNAGPVYGMITMKFQSNDDLINLALLKDCVDRYYQNQITLALTMDYVPYARQDRVCNKGESLSIKVIANLINSLGFKYVYTKDNHSEVATALIHNCINVDISVLADPLRTVLPNGLNTILISPDAGANKKVYAFAKSAGFKHVVRADKTRDVATGKITGTKVYWDVSQTINPMKDTCDVCIIDDIADGGYTFTELAKELRKFTDGKIYLYITHGIFSKGLNVFDGRIDGIFVSNMMYCQSSVDMLLNPVQVI
jgi:ribose-phosphate pyrophosphokinase